MSKEQHSEAHVENAGILVQCGAKIDARNEDGFDAVMIKAVRQEIPLLTIYLPDKAGAEIGLPGAPC